MCSSRIYYSFLHISKSHSTCYSLSVIITYIHAYIHDLLSFPQCTFPDRRTDREDATASRTRKLMDLWNS